MITPAYSPTATERVLPRMALDFTTGTLDSRVTVTRALNTATAINSSGFIAVVNANLPRFDYDPVTLAPKGLLIEESRINITLHSGFTAANWTASGGALANTGKTSPDGTTQMGLFTENTATSAHQTFVTTPPSLFVVGTTYTGSVYLAAGTRRYVVVQCGPNGSNWGVTVDTQTWTISGDFFTGGCAFTSASIVNVGNGIYRVTITGVQNSGGGTQAYLVVGGSLIADALNAGTSYLGNGSTFYAWGAQVEAGAFATSYIPTTTTSLTRNGDQVSMTGTNFSSWYNGAAGTFGIEADSATVASVGFLLTADDGTNNNRFGFYRSSSALAGYIVTSGSVEMELTRSTIVANTAFKATVAATANNGNLAFNTSLAAGDNTITMPAVTRLTIGGSGGAVAWFGHIAKISYWPQRLLNAELQAFSK